MHEFSGTVLPQQTTPASRAGKATRGLQNAYRAMHMRYYCTTWFIMAVQGLHFRSAYHTLVDEEGWTGHVDYIQKTEIILVPYRAPSAPRSSLPSSCSLHDASRQQFAPELRKPRAAIDGMTSVRPFSYYSLEPPSTACLFKTSAIGGKTIDRNTYGVNGSSSSPAKF